MIFLMYKSFCALKQTLNIYPEIVPLRTLIACNAINWPGGTAIYFSHKFHHWLMLYTFGQYIVNMQWSITGDGFLTIFKFRIRFYFGKTFLWKWPPGRFTVLMDDSSSFQVAVPFKGYPMNSMFISRHNCYCEFSLIEFFPVRQFDHFCQVLTDI